MCQVSVVLEHKGGQEKVMENVTLLKVSEKGVEISAFFEEPRFFEDARVDQIDFLNGTVTLRAAKGK